MTPRIHARFLTYREKHAYFGRGDQREALDLKSFAALDGERAALAANPHRTPQEDARLVELRRTLHDL